MAKNVSESNRKVLQNIRTQRIDSDIRTALQDTVAMGEIAVQLGSGATVGESEKNTGLWVLAADGVTAVRFASQKWITDKIDEITGSASTQTKVIDNIIEAVGLQSTGDDKGSMPNNWKDGTTYISATTTDVLGAIKDLDKAIKDIDDSIVDDLNLEHANSDADKIIYDFAQHDGLVGSAQTKNVGEFTLAGYTGGTDTKIAESQKLNTALGNLQAQIDAMDKTGTTEDGKVVTYVTEADGKVSENKELLTSIKLNGYTGTTGTVTANDTVGQAIDKIEKEILSAKTATSVASADGSITVTTADTGTDIAVNIRANEHVLAKDGNAGLYTNLVLSGVAPSSVVVKEEFKLFGTDGTQLGDSIKVYKDSAYKEIYLGTSADTVNTTTGEITKLDGDKESLNYVYMKADGTYEMVKVDLEQFLTESEFGDGLKVDGHHVSVMIDKDSENFLTVGPDGILLSGVQHAISTAMASGKTEINTTVGGDATNTHLTISAATAADGHTVYGFTLTGVASQSDLEALSGSVLDLDATVTGKTADNHVAIEIVETDGKLTSVTLTGTDIASTSALTAEITRAKTAEAALDTVIGSTKNADNEDRTYGHENTNYLNNNDSVKKDVEAIDDILGKTTGTTFSEQNSVAKVIDDIKAQIESAKTSLALTATDDNKYIAATVTSAATGTEIRVVGVAQDIAASTSATTGIADAYNVKQYAINDVIDVNPSTKITVKAEANGVRKLDVSKLCVDCGTF